MNGVELDSYTSKIYYDNGQLKCEIIFQNKELNGPTKGWYDDGSIKFEGFWRNNKRHGVWTDFDKQGSNSQTYWHEGKKIKFNSKHADLMWAFLRNIGYKIEKPCSNLRLNICR